MGSVPSPYAFSIRTEFPITLTMAGHRMPEKSFSHKTRIRPDFVCYVMKKGQFHFTNSFAEGDVEFRLKKSMFHVLLPGIYETQLKNMSKGDEFLWFHFETESPYELLTKEQAKQLLIDQSQENSPQKFWVLPVNISLADQFQTFSDLHGRIFKNISNWGIWDQGGHLYCNLFLYQMHQWMMSQLIGVGTSTLVNIKRQHVVRAQIIMQDSYGTLDSLADVASRVHLNAAYLSRCFKEYTEMTVGSYLLDCRIRAAKRLIQEGPLGMKEIADQCGFNSLNYFCRMFKQAVGKTAKEYRLKKTDQ